MPDGIFDPKQGQSFAAFSSALHQWGETLQMTFAIDPVDSAPESVSPPVPPTRYEKFASTLNESVSVAVFYAALFVLSVWRGIEYGILRARQRADELFFEK